MKQRFYSVVTFKNLLPGRHYTVKFDRRVEAMANLSSAEWQYLRYGAFNTLPRRVPTQSQNPFTIAIGSCRDILKTRSTRKTSKVPTRIFLVPLLLALSGLSMAQQPKPDISWEPVSSADNIVVQRGITERAFNAFRGTTVIQAKIGKVISVLLNRDRAKEWQYKLVDSAVLREEDNRRLIWSRTKTPFPFNDRDFLYVAEATFDESSLSFSVVLTDVSQSELVPMLEELALIPKSRSVRGTIVHGEWHLDATLEGGTCVNVELFLRANGNLGYGALRGFEANWPRSSLKDLGLQVEKDDITLHPDFGQWSTRDHPSLLSGDECIQRNAGGTR
jgi:hypothetical protein